MLQPDLKFVLIEINLMGCVDAIDKDFCQPGHVYKDVNGKSLLRLLSVHEGLPLGCNSNAQ